MCLCSCGCVPACLRSHPRLLPTASDQQFRGGQRSGPDQREDAPATWRRQQCGPVDGPHEHGRAQWDRQQQQYTVMDIHSHMPRHIPAVTTVIWYHIYRSVYILDIYTHKKHASHTHTHSISYTEHATDNAAHTYAVTHTRLPTPLPLPSAVCKGMSVPGLYHQRLSLFTELIGPI